MDEDYALGRIRDLEEVIESLTRVVGLLLVGKRVSFGRRYSTYKYKVKGWNEPYEGVVQNVACESITVVADSGEEFMEPLEDIEKVV